MDSIANGQASLRNEHTCPGEIPKSFLTKACVSTAMPLGHPRPKYDYQKPFICMAMLASLRFYGKPGYAHFLVILFLLLGISSVWAKTSLGLNDVSVLIPLPKTEEDIDLLLKPQDGFIPKEFLVKLDPLIIDDHTQDRVRSLKLIAFRIDPCFVESVGPAACRRQLRMVFQPVSFYQHSALVFDTAVHAFLNSTIELGPNFLKIGLRRSRISLPKKPLQVHPVLRRQSLQGPLWRTYRQILLKHAMPDRLIRLTQSTVDRFGMTWEFSGFDITSSGDLIKLTIPRVDVTKQVFFSNPGDLKEFQCPRSRPFLKAKKSWLNSLRDLCEQSNHCNGTLSKSPLSLKIPSVFNTANLDCVSCHMAQSLRLWGESHFGNLSANTDIRAIRFTSPRDLGMTAKPFSITNRVRAFGYFFDEANISPRVINESALAADALEQLLK